MVTWAARADRLDDATLLAAIALGDAEACTVFVRRYQRQVYGLAVTMCHDSQVAEDVAQQTFERAWRHAGSFDPRLASVHTWVLTICRRLAIDVLRARHTVALDPEDLVVLLPPTASSAVEDAAATSVEAAAAEVALRRLPDEQRRAVVLASIAGRTAAEIADLEDIPLGTAKTRIRLGLRRLRADLIPAGGADG